jgi:hypothetical protein
LFKDPLWEVEFYERRYSAGRHPAVIRLEELQEFYLLAYNAV